MHTNLTKEKIMRKNTKQSEFEKNLELIWMLNDKIDEYPDLFPEYFKDDEIEFFSDMYTCLFKKYECNSNNIKRYENMINEKLKCMPVK